MTMIGERPRGSAADGALGLDIERVDRLTCRHEQAVALDPAETEVGAALWQHDAADHRTIGRENDDPVLGLAARPGAPQIAAAIDPHAVAAARLGGVELMSVGNAGAVIDNIVDLDRAPPRTRRVDDVEQLLVG